MTSRLVQFGIVRFASVANAIVRELRLDRPPACRIGHGRIVLTFRGIGASRWPESQQIAHAHRVAAIAREVLAMDSRSTIRRRAARAIVIVYEDATAMLGSAVSSRWECVVPAPRGVSLDD